MEDFAKVLVFINFALFPELVVNIIPIGNIYACMVAALEGWTRLRVTFCLNDVE